MKKVKIRDAASTEIEIIREQRIFSYTEHSQSVPSDHWNALKIAISTDADIQEGVELIVAEVEGEIVGSVVLFPANTNAYEGNLDELEFPEMRMLAVAPSARGKGVASSLVDECVRRSKENGYRAIGLHTGQFMKNAINLYERLGFKRLPEYDFEPADDGIMVLAYQLTI